MQFKGVRYIAYLIDRLQNILSLKKIVSVQLVRLLIEELHEPLASIVNLLSLVQNHIYNLS